MTKRRATPNGCQCPKCGKRFRGQAIGAHALHCSVTSEDLFWAKVDKSGACWLWTGAKENHGYGHFRIGKKDFRAHRYSYELVNGPIPKGMHILHSCDVYACVNPAHLRPGTHAENMADMDARGRRVRGERTTRNKLTEDQARQILKEYRFVGHGRCGRSNARELAARYGVGTNTITAIPAGRTWAYLKDKP